MFWMDLACSCIKWNALVPLMSMWLCTCKKDVLNVMRGDELASHSSCVCVCVTWRSCVDRGLLEEFEHSRGFTSPFAPSSVYRAKQPRQPWMGAEPLQSKHTHTRVCTLVMFKLMDNFIESWQLLFQFHSIFFHIFKKLSFRWTKAQLQCGWKARIEDQDAFSNLCYEDTVLSYYKTVLSHYKLTCSS